MSCNQCVALMINGVFCHETGCPNTGKTIVKKVRRSYVAIRKSDRKRVLVQTSLMPSEYLYPEYAAFIGPFKTVRAAKWAVDNAWNWSHVSDAEILSKVSR